MCTQFSNLTQGCVLFVRNALLSYYLSVWRFAIVLDARRTGNSDAGEIVFQNLNCIFFAGSDENGKGWNKLN